LVTPRKPSEDDTSEDDGQVLHDYTEIKNEYLKEEKVKEEKKRELKTKQVKEKKRKTVRVKSENIAEQSGRNRKKGKFAEKLTENVDLIFHELFGFGSSTPTPPAPSKEDLSRDMGK